MDEDLEVTAISLLCKALAPLDKKAVKRVLGWAEQRFLNQSGTKEIISNSISLDCLEIVLSAALAEAEGDLDHLSKLHNLFQERASWCEEALAAADDPEEVDE